MFSDDEGNTPSKSKKNGKQTPSSTANNHALQQANSSYYSTPIAAMPIRSSSAPHYGFGGTSSSTMYDVPVPQPGTKAFEKAQQDQLQRMFDESLCILLRRKGAEAMRTRILEAVQQQAQEMGKLDETLSSVWEGMTSTILETETKDSALNTVPSDLQPFVANSALTDADLAGESEALTSLSSQDDHQKGARQGGRTSKTDNSSTSSGWRKKMVSVGCNTVNRGEAEKDTLIAQLKRSKADADKTIETLKKEVASIKKLLASRPPQVATTTSNAPTVSSNASAPHTTSSSNTPPGSIPELMESPRSFLPAISSPTNQKSTQSTTPVRCSSTQPQSNTATRRSAGGGGFSTTPPQASTPQPSAVNMDSFCLSASASTGPSLSTSKRQRASNRGGNTSVSSSGSSGSGGAQTVKMKLQKLQQQVRELRGKLSAIKTGVKAFSFNEVFAQFTQHVIPPIHNLASSNMRLIDRNYVLEKTCLDFLSRIGTMPDLNSTEGYLPEGGPLHIGSYSMMEDKRFEDWIGKMQSTFMTKACKIQELINRLSSDVHKTIEQNSGSKRDFTNLEDRCQALESITVENECLLISNISDVLDGLHVPQARRTEFNQLTKGIQDMNEEVRVACTIIGWSGKPAARVKVNMWRQRRAEAMQRLEQMLMQDLQHFVTGGAAKSQLRAKITSLREISQSMSRLHLMPSVRQSANVSSPISVSGSNQSFGTASPPVPSPVKAGSSASSHASHVTAALNIVGNDQQLQQSTGSLRSSTNSNRGGGGGGGLSSTPGDNNNATTNASSSSLMGLQLHLNQNKSLQQQVQQQQRAPQFVSSGTNDVFADPMQQQQRGGGGGGGGGPQQGDTNTSQTTLSSPTIVSPSGQHQRASFSKNGGMTPQLSVGGGGSGGGGSRRKTNITSPSKLPPMNAGAKEGR